MNREDLSRGGDMPTMDEAISMDARFYVSKKLGRAG